MLVLLALNFKSILNNRKNIPIVVLASGFVAVVVLTAIIWGSKDYLFQYYFKWNVDVGKQTNILSSIDFCINSVVLLLGNRIVLIAIAASLLMIVGGRYKMLLTFLFIVLAVFLPYLISGAGDNRFTIIPGALITTLPVLLVFSGNKKSRMMFYSLGIMYAYLFLNNMSTLSKNIKATDDTERVLIENFIKDIDIVKYEGKYISGMVPVAPAIKSIVSLNSNVSLNNGKYYFHSTTFGFDKRFIDSEFEGVINKALDDICIKPGLFFVLSDNVRDNQDAYLFTLKYNQKINKLIKDKQCFSKLKYTLEYEGNEVSVYEIK